MMPNVTLNHMASAVTAAATTAAIFMSHWLRAASIRMACEWLTTQYAVSTRIQPTTTSSGGVPASW